MISSALTTALLRWYDGRRGEYPWRGTPDPYRVLVSEVMLQQTQAGRVAPVYERFVARFPDVATLAATDRADVLRAWEALGYNRRAVALSEAARTIVADHAGRVPADVEVLRSLPGVGPYTAAAVAAIGFGRPVIAMDTNVRRVVGRVTGLHGGATPDIERSATAWLGRGDPSAWHQAVMDLGRTHCRPRARCGSCPVRRWCPSADAAVPPPRRARVGAFEGSSRQVRGAIVRVLRATPSSSLAALAKTIGVDLDVVHRAVVGLNDDGVVAASRAALDGAASARVRLAGDGVSRVRGRPRARVGTPA